MRRLLAYAIVVISVLSAGCATTGDIERVEQKVTVTNSELLAIRTDLDQLGGIARQDNRQTAERLGRVAADIAAVREDLEVIKRNQASLGSAMNTMAGGELMDVTGQMEELRHEVETSKLKIDAVKAALLQKLADIETMIVEMGATAGQPAAAGTLQDRSIPDGSSGSGAGAASSGPPPVADPLVMYQAAYLDYTKGNYDLALMGFKDYVTSFPDGEFAGNAQYWTGESLYSLGRYKEALVEFEKVLGNYPQSTKAPGAMLKKGFCFDALGRADDAAAAYRRVMDVYPASDAAKLAADRLKSKTRGQVPGR